MAATASEARLLIVLLVVTGLDAGEWTIHGRYQYLINNNRMFWDDGLKFCAHQKSTAFLARPTTKNAEFLKTFGSEKMYLADHRYRKTKGWVWSDGSPLTASDILWKKGYPKYVSDGSIGQYERRSAELMNDEPNFRRFAVVCQAPLDPTPQPTTTVQPTPTTPEPTPTKPEPPPTTLKPPPTTPEPTPTKPEPTPTASEPTPTKPEPTPTASEPTPTKPEPTPTKPEPTPTKPKPTPTKPEPTPTTPEPTPTTPEPTPTKPETTPTTSEPTPTKPEPTPTKPDPTPTKPEPTPTKPEPTPTTSEPIPTTSEPTPTKPDPTTMKPVPTSTPEPTITSAGTTPAPDACPSGAGWSAVTENDRCFYFSAKDSNATKLSWRNAHSACLGMEADLVSVPDPATFYTLSFFVSSANSGDTWNGLLNIPVAGLSWSDDSSYNEELNRFIVNDKEGKFGYLSPVDGNFHLDNGIAVRPFICSIDNRRPTPSPRPTPTAPPCPDDWQHLNGTCYLFAKEQHSWTAASHSCHQLGASMVSIHEQTLITFLLVSGGNDVYWTGLQNQGDVFVWQDESTTTDIELLKPYMDPWQSGKDCVAMNRSQYQQFLVHENCFTERGYVCQKDVNVQ